MWRDALIAPRGSSTAPGRWGIISKGCTAMFDAKIMGRLATDMVNNFMRSGVTVRKVIVDGSNARVFLNGITGRGSPKTATISVEGTTAYYRYCTMTVPREFDPSTGNIVWR
jgi:hypothetical protein